MRKLISILIAVMMVLTLLPVGRVFAEDEGTEVTGAPEEGTTTPEDLTAAKEETKKKIKEMSDLTDDDKTNFCNQVDKKKKKTLSKT